MRFMIIVKATAESEAAAHPAPDEALLAAMADYHEKLAKAGVLLDASGLKPSAQGWRIRYDGESRRVIDGPFTETKELIGGYTLIQVKTREEGLEWARRFPVFSQGQSGGMIHPPRLTSTPNTNRRPKQATSSPLPSAYSSTSRAPRGGQWLRLTQSRPNIPMME